MSEVLTQIQEEQGERRGRSKGVGSQCDFLKEKIVLGKGKGGTNGGRGLGLFTEFVSSCCKFRLTIAEKKERYKTGGGEERKAGGNIS